MSNVVLFSATGQQGLAVAKKLVQDGHSVLAPVRSEGRKTELEEKGYRAVVTDFSLSSLTAIVGQGDAVVLQIPALIMPAEMISFAETALNAIKAAGSPHTVVSISSVVPKQPVGLAGPDARLRLKELSHQVLPEAIVLSATLYLENFSQAYRSAIEQGSVIPQPVPENVPVAYLSLADLAAYVAAAVRKTDAKGRFIPIGGARAITGTELAEIFSRALGKPVTYTTLPPHEFVGILTPMLGEVIAGQIAEMYEWEGASGSAALSPDVQEAQRLLGVQPQAIDEWVRETFGGARQEG